MSSFGPEYLAGLFDGEGCIVIQARNKFSTGPIFQLRVTITLREGWLLEEIQNEFGGSLCAQKSKYVQRATCFSLYQWGDGAVRFLETIYPHLRLKKGQAFLGIFFHTHKSGGRRRTEAEVLAQTEQAALMKQLNCRGVDRWSQGLPPPRLTGAS